MSICNLNGRWEYSFDQKLWKCITLPANWYLRGLDVSGVVWFRRQFQAPEDQMKNASVLRFHGVDYFAEVWLNGEYLGKHEGYFQPFEFKTSGLLRKQNTLLVRVDSPRESPRVWPYEKRIIKGIFGHHDCRPGGWNPVAGQDKNTGGIWNNVEIETFELLRIPSVKVRSKILNQSRASVNVEITIEAVKPIENAQLKVEIADAAGRVVSRNISASSWSRGQNFQTITMGIKQPHLWWSWDQGKPYLYTLTVIAGIAKQSLSASLQIQFGIREVRYDEQEGLFLNGRHIFPRGTNIIPTQWLSEYTEQKIEHDIQMLKDANINLVRVHAHVNRTEFYSACDRAGIMVWQDFALQWEYAHDDEFAGHAQKQILDMVDLLYNHPSILFWCCHNEPSVRQRETLDVQLKQVVDARDSTRVVVRSSDFEHHPYPGWFIEGGLYDYDPDYSELKFVTEFGCEALPSVSSLKKTFNKKDLWPPNWKTWKYHNFQYHQTFDVAKVKMGCTLVEMVRNTQEHQATMLKRAIEHYRRNKYRLYTGIFQFMFCEPWPSITYAVVDYWRKPKKGYFALKKAYQQVLVSFYPATRTARRHSGTWIKWYLINDLPRAIHCDIKYWMETPSGTRVCQGKISADCPCDSVVQLPGEKLTSQFAKYCDKTKQYGKHRFCAEVYERGKKISENDCEVTILRPVTGL